MTLSLTCCAVWWLGCNKHESASNPSTQPAPASPRELKIAAAADLKFALDQAAASFHASHPDISIQITYGSSGNFYSQLAARAPFDLFLSADIGYPRRLIAEGLALKDSQFIYAIGRIVLWTPKGSKLDITRRGMDALLDPSVKKIAIANPQHAPYGRAAEAALKSHQLWDKLQDKLVMGENIAQTAQFAQTGSADVGIIALSLALAPQMKDQGEYFLVPAADYPPLEQGGVILSWTGDRAAADAFRAFIVDPEGRAILKDYGFESPPNPG